MIHQQNFCVQNSQYACKKNISFAKNVIKLSLLACERLQACPLLAVLTSLYTVFAVPLRESSLIGDLECS